MSDKEDANAQTILGVAQLPRRAGQESAGSEGALEGAPPESGATAPAADSAADHARARVFAVGSEANQNEVAPISDSVERRLAQDSDKSGLEIGELDWELPDDFDPPSGIDSVMTMGGKSTRGKSESPSGDDSLPSTSALFGADYREVGVQGVRESGSEPQIARVDLEIGDEATAGAAEEFDPNAATQLLAGEVDRRVVERKREDASERALANSADSEAAPDLAMDAESPDVERPAAAADEVGTRREQSTANLAVVGAAPVTGVPLVEPELERVGPASRSASGSGAALAPSASSSGPREAPIDLGAPKPGRSYSIASVTGGEKVVMRSQSGPVPRASAPTPLVNPRLDGATPIVASPIIAARAPTPDSGVERVSAMAPAVKSQRGRSRGTWVAMGVLSLVVIAAIVFAVLR